MIEIRKRTTPHYPKNYALALMLCCFFGMFGIHRFYTGYKRLGFSQLTMFCSFVIMYGLHRFYTENKVFFVTELILLCGLGVWWFIDLVSMCFNSYKDKYGIEMEEYNGTLAGLALTGFVIVLLAIACFTFIPLLFG